MKNIILISFSLLSLLGKNFAQDTSIIKYLPLKVGNVWVYSCSQSGNPPTCGICTKRIKVVITNTLVINGHLYYQGSLTTIHISGICSFCNSMIPDFINIRVDSLNGNVLGYSTNSGCSYRPNEILYDSLRARLYDSIRYNCQPPTQFTAYVCRDTNNVVIFGQSRQSRGYSVQGFESGWGRGYVKNIGITGSGASSVYCYNNTQLLGCVINGVVYGDTGFVVGINNISSEIPWHFSLLQNYPNPFNPSTKIIFSFSNPSEGRAYKTVQLIVYDASGEEVQTLVNEQLQPGTYEVEFPAPTGDGSNFSSGVYYYTLSAEDCIITKKMVLIK